METTGRNLVEHWSWAAKKGLMNRNTAGGLRAACQRILSVHDDWENVDVSQMDVDDTIRRFINLNKTKFKPAVLRIYEARFRQAVSSYLDYIEDPGRWKPTSRPRAERVARKGSTEDAPAPGLDTTTAWTNLFLTAGSRKDPLIEYPFPLREQLTAVLRLPRDLKSHEVKRLTAFMQTLIVGDEDVGG